MSKIASSEMLLRFTLFPSDVGTGVRMWGDDLGDGCESVGDVNQWEM
jgi:hypothetical protein